MTFLPPYVAILLGVASGPSPLAVIPLVPLRGDVEPALAAQITASIRDELARQNTLTTLLDAAAIASRPVDIKASAGASTWGAFLSDLAEGRTLLKKLRVPQAIKALKRASETVMREPADIQDFGQVVELHTLLAEAYFRRGKEALGTEALEQIVRLRPEYQLPADRFPPLFESVFDKLRTRVTASVSGSLEVTTDRPATVFLDGREVGKAPVHVMQLIPGNHVLVVRGPSVAMGEVIAVAEGVVTRRQVSVAPGQGTGNLADDLAQNRFESETRRAALNAAAKSHAEFVVLGVVGREGEGLTVACALGSVRTSSWASLGPMRIDIDLLSASIEAETLVAALLAQLRSFSPDSRELKKLLTPSTSRESIRAAVPLPAARGTESDLELIPPPKLAGPRRDVRAPVDAGGERRVVASRDVGVAAKPVVQPRESTVMAAPVAPPGEVSLHANQAPSTDSGSIIQRWWFWTAVGGGLAAAGVGVWAVVLRDSQPTSVKVYAAW